MYTFMSFGQSGQIGGQLDKNAVILNAADNAPDRFSRRQPGRVLLPCSQKLAVGQADASHLRVYRRDNGADFLLGVKAFTRVCNP